MRDKLPEGTPRHAELDIQSEERMSSRQLGVEFVVRIKDADGKAIDGWPFTVKLGDETITRGETDESGEYTDRTILEVREGTQKSLFLVLEGSVVSDWKKVPSRREDSPQQREARSLERDEVAKKLEEDARKRAQMKEEEDRRLKEEQRQAEIRERESREKLKKEILKGNRPIGKGESITLEKAEYDIVSDVLVEEGGELIIEAGSVLRFRQDAGINCKGRLKAVGTKEDPILFDAHVSKWKNIALIGKGTEGSRLEHCQISNGTGRTYKPKGASNENKYGGGMLIAETDSAKIELFEIILDSNTAVIGGGLACIDASPKISSINICNNESIENGGGAFFRGSSSPIEMGVIEKNKAGQKGGGFYAEKSPIKLTKSFVLSNEAEKDGGGLALEGSPLVIEDLEICGNCTKKRGGGIFLSNSNIEAIHIKIADNKSEVDGGGMFINASSIVVENGEIRKNATGDSTGDEKGGGMAIEQSEVRVSNLLIIDNSSVLGGGINLDKSSLSITSSKVSSNSAEMVGGIRATESSIKGIHSVVKSNRSGTEGEGVQFKKGRKDLIGESFEIREDKVLKKLEEALRGRELKEVEARECQERNEFLSGKRTIKSGESLYFPKGTYESQAEMCILKGGILKLAAGVTFRFGANAGIKCMGTLMAKDVCFEGMWDDKKGDHVMTWGNIQLIGEGNTDSDINGCQFKNGDGNKLFLHKIDSKSFFSRKSPHGLLGIVLIDCPQETYDRICVWGGNEKKRIDKEHLWNNGWKGIQFS